MKLHTFVLLLGSLLTLPLANAATIQLTQEGWDAGGPLSITFTGDDLDLSGYIDTAELVSFTAQFMLPGGGAATWSLPDLGSDGFAFASTDDYFIKADGPFYSLYETAFGGTSIALISDQVGSIYLSGEPLQQAASTPEPSAGLLFGGGVLVLMAAKKFR